MEKNVFKIIDLFRRSCKNELNEKEKQEFETLMKDNVMRGIFERMKDEKYLLERVEELKSYDYRKAFACLKTRARKYRRLKWMLGVASAAVLLVGVFSLAVWQEADDTLYQTGMTVKENRIFPGKKQAVLRLTDGRIVKIQDDTLKIREKGGTSIKYERGELSYLSKGESVSEADSNELIIPVGGECFVRLDDGTEVWLNADSRLKYPLVFGKSTREVYLEGEAYFNVKRDEKRSFVVHTGFGEIDVLGTSFGVSAYSGTEGYVTLVNGKVSCTSVENEKVILIPGRQAVMPKAGDMRVRDVDVQEYVGWKDGWFVFNNKSLKDIMIVLERWYDIKVEFRDEGLRSLTFTGNLRRYDDITVFLELLRRLREVRYEISEEAVVLYK